MNLPEICIKRPVFTVVLSLLIVVIGMIFFTKLQLRGIPSILPPIIIVNASYGGADAKYMEQQITNRIEDQLKTVKNIDFMSSTSSTGSSNIVIAFKLDTDIETCLNDVRSKIDQISNLFPADMILPSVEKIDADNFPVMWLSIFSDRHDELELTSIAGNQVKDVLDKLEAVGSSFIYGGKYYDMRIEPNVTKMFAHKISPIEIERAIMAQNRDYPAGFIKTDVNNFTLRLAGSLNDSTEFENIIVKTYPDGSLVKLKDIADVGLVPREDDSILRYNGQRSMALGIVKQSTANILQLSDGVHNELENIRKKLPKGIKVEIAYDGSIPVMASIKAVFFTIFEAIILVSLVIYVFLGSARVTLIPLVTIPVSLIGTFTVMYFLGFSINTFTLLAMILAIGLVVDDAIVVLENIFRHHHEFKKTPAIAALDASKEIGFAIIAMTITLASVFLPIGFIEGFLGKLFIEFAWTLAFCVLFSGFVALTLTPMLTSRVIKEKEDVKPKFLQKFDKYLLMTQDAYIHYLTLALNHKKKFYMIASSSVVVLVLSFMYVKKTFIPGEDQSFLQISFTGPEGSSVIESEKSVVKAEEILAQHKDVFGFFEVIGWRGSGESAFAFVPLKDWSLRSKSQDQIRNELNAKFAAIPGMSIFAMNPQSLESDSSSGKSLEFCLQTTLGYEELDLVSQEFMKRMKQNPIFQNIDNDYKSSTPTLDILVDREKVYKYGANLETIGTTVQYLIAGRKIGDFRFGNDIYDVTLNYRRAERSNLSDLGRIFIKTAADDYLPLQVFADIVEKITVKSYNHYNNSRSITISSDYISSSNMKEAVDAIENIAKDLIDNNSVTMEYLGEIKRMKQASNGIIITFLLALVFIYLVLSAQFESFSDPMIILTAVPFSITGGVLALLLFGDTLNMYSNIGLITLIGLVTKNSIMLVEFTHQLRERGMKIHEALIESSRLRLRPILMTSIATIFGAIPLVLAHGAGAASRNSIGLVIVGGMIVGTIFTIFVIPVLYETFKKEEDLSENHV